MYNVKHFTYSTVALALIMAGGANATTYRADTTPEQIAELQTKAAKLNAIKANRAQEVKRSLKGNSQSIMNVASSLANGDELNRDINASSYFKYYECESSDVDAVCERQPSDMSNSEIHIAFVYDPFSLAKQRTLGAFYRYAADTVAEMNEGFVASKLDTRVKLVAFNEIDISDWYEKQQQAFIGSGKEIFLELSPEAYVPEDLSWDTPMYEYQGDDGYVHQGIANLAFDIWQHTHNYFLQDYKTNFTVALKKAGTDAILHISGKEDERPGLCGASLGAGGVIIARDNMSVDNKLGCGSVELHELGHSLLAEHEREYGSGGQDIYNRASAALECGLDENETVRPSIMYHVATGLKVFSSPENINDGYVCGDEVERNNAKQVALSSPYMANMSDAMTVVGTAYIDGELTQTAEIGEQGVSITITRDGDLTAETKVSLYLDGSLILHHDEWGNVESTTEIFEADYFNVEFAAGEASKVVTLNFTDGLTLQENVAVYANLVMPLQLDINADAQQVQLEVLANDVVDPVDPDPVDPVDPDPVVPEPVVPEPIAPEPSKSSGGGSLGWLAIFGLALVARFRK